VVELSSPRKSGGPSICAGSFSLKSGKASLVKNAGYDPEKVVRLLRGVPPVSGFGSKGFDI